jgi:hypothetical protein
MAQANDRSAPMKPATAPDERAGEGLPRTTSGNTIEKDSLAVVGADEEREHRIRQAAYRRAEARGFVPGGELDDWIAAEREEDDARGASSVG